jgi:hypothetical protein
MHTLTSPKQKPYTLQQQPAKIHARLPHVAPDAVVL